MNTSTLTENQLLATKFYVPVTSGTLISRPRLSALLQESFNYPLTLVSAPAGFGKTTLLSVRTKSLRARHPLVAWVSLDEEDNTPWIFWTYILAALEKQRPNRFSNLLTRMPSIPSEQVSALTHVLKGLINLLIEGQEHFLLILDDYHVITEQQVHTTLSYLIGHIPPQLRIILATRADPPLSFSQLRARKQLLEIRTNQLRCTVEETKAFFKEVMSIELPEETIQEITARTEGWLVGLQSLGLSLPERVNPLLLLQEVCGDQCYILDYLTEQVLQQQPQDVQTFLLFTSILERLTASLCNVVTQQPGSQRMIERLEQANLFTVSLDNRHQWYRYHALFAEALQAQLERTHADFVPILHSRASLWYAEHDQTTQAIVHAFRAHQWQQAADLIERKSLELISLTWGVSERELFLLQQWLKQLPGDILGAHPRLCLACAHIVWTVAPYSILDGWLDIAEARLIDSLETQGPGDASPVRQEQKNLLGELICWRAMLRCYRDDDGLLSLELCQRAIVLSAENTLIRAQAAWVQLLSFYVSSANNAGAAIESGLQGCSLARTAGQNALALAIMGTTAMCMVGAGQLNEIEQLTQQAMQLGDLSAKHPLPPAGYPAHFRAELLREWNQLDAALSLAQEAIALCKEVVSFDARIYLLFGYAVLLRIYLSRRDLDAARSALEEFECIAREMNPLLSLHFFSFFTTINQVKLWLACGELEYAQSWIKVLEMTEQHGTPFERERREVARVRILLATAQPAFALERLEPVLERATKGQRWGHVIEMRILQALAYQMLQQQSQAFSALSEALCLAEPESYIRSFVDEGPPMATLLSKLREEQRKQGPNPYLDRVLATFSQQDREQKCQQDGLAQSTKGQALLDPLSERELEVLQLLASGVSNQQIAQELVIALDTVKRHVSHILSKLGAKNRLQAVKRARELGLLE